jgi:hypothetical protein
MQSDPKKSIFQNPTLAHSQLVENNANAPFNRMQASTMQRLRTQCKKKIIPMMQCNSIQFANLGHVHLGLGGNHVRLVDSSEGHAVDCERACVYGMRMQQRASTKCSHAFQRPHFPQNHAIFMQSQCINAK